MLAARIHEKIQMNTAKTGELEEGEIHISENDTIDDTYRIPHGSAPYFVGREGRNFQGISNNRKVEITIPKTPGNLIYIKGTKQNIKDTYDDLDEIKERFAASQNQRQKDGYDAPCRYFAK